MSYIEAEGTEAVRRAGCNSPSLLGQCSSSPGVIYMNYSCAVWQQIPVSYPGCLVSAQVVILLRGFISLALNFIY